MLFTVSLKNDAYLSLQKSSKKVILDVCPTSKYQLKGNNKNRRKTPMGFILVYLLLHSNKYLSSEYGCYSKIIL